MKILPQQQQQKQQELRIKTQNAPYKRMRETENTVKRKRKKTLNC